MEFFSFQLPASEAVLGSGEIGRRQRSKNTTSHGLTFEGSILVRGRIPHSIDMMSTNTDAWTHFRGDRHEDLLEARIHEYITSWISCHSISLFNPISSIINYSTLPLNTTTTTSII